MDLQELKKEKQQLRAYFPKPEKLIENPSTLRKQEILFSILKKLADKK